MPSLFVSVPFLISGRYTLAPANILPVALSNTFPVKVNCCAIAAFVNSINALNKNKKQIFFFIFIEYGMP
jgi:hypothetical protein